MKLTWVGNLLLKWKQHLAAKLLTTYNILKVKSAYDKLWDKFDPERTAKHFLMKYQAMIAWL